MIHLILKKQHPHTYSFSLDLYQLQGDDVPKDRGTTRGLRWFPKGRQFCHQVQSSNLPKDRQGRKDKRDHQRVYMQSKPHIQIETWHPLPYSEVGGKNDLFQSQLPLPYSQARRDSVINRVYFWIFILWYTRFLTLYVGPSNAIVF